MTTANVVLFAIAVASLAYNAWQKWGHRLRDKTAAELEEIARELRGE